MYNVLLFYKFVEIANPDQEVLAQKELCSALGITGRVLINEQGINGTVAGTKQAIDKYAQAMKDHELFKDTDFKETTSAVEPFPKLKVKYRKEIITSGAPEQCNLANRGKHITCDEFHQWLEAGEDMVILDLRNDYEYEVGRFRGAIKPPMKYFRDVKDYMEFFDQFKDKKIVMYCTGGIRCEPASAMFIEHGFKKDNIYQLLGGIVKYAEKYANDGHYQGSCFVFDERMIVPVNTTSSRVVTGRCMLCKCVTEEFRNCANKYCNRLFLGCDGCAIELKNTCSKDCVEVIKNPRAMRPARQNDARVKHRNKL
jgi:UPF0176 protein